MANYNRGVLHSKGYVAGSLSQGISGIGLAVLCFVFAFFISGTLLKLVLLFAGLACISFAIYSFAMYVQYKEFGSGSGHNILHSENYDPSQNRPLYNASEITSIVSGIVCFLFGITAFVLLRIAHPWESLFLDILMWTGVVVFSIIIFLFLGLAVKLHHKKRY